MSVADVAVEDIEAEDFVVAGIALDGRAVERHD
jgi:hypothetical protein